MKKKCFVTLPPRPMFNTFVVRNLQIVTIS
jgi:hypothetical protein